jgi:hypothetical protein
MSRTPLTKYLPEGGARNWRVVRRSQLNVWLERLAILSLDLIKMYAISFKLIFENALCDG